MTSSEAGSTLGELGEDAVLAAVLEAMGEPTGDGGRAAVVAAGDDAAVLAAVSGSVVVTTDSMVRGRDWRDSWSSPQDVGRKVVVQNLADVAAMGARPTGLVVALAADPATPLTWAIGLAEGIGAAARDAGAAVVGGDLSGAPEGAVVVAVTALGDLDGRDPVLRSGARAGDVVAVAGTLGRSGGGLALYFAGDLPGEATDHPGHAAELLRRVHRTAGAPPFVAGRQAADAGASAMIDVSDGLVRDLGRVARASGVDVDLDPAALRAEADGPLTEVLGPDEALRQVLGGGEEHALVATFAAGAVPEGWRGIGVVRPVAGDAPAVTVDGAATDAPGWDHFAR